MNIAVATNTDETMSKKEFQNVRLQEVKTSGGMRLALNSFAELEKFSNFMAVSNFVPKHLRQKPADCLAVLLQSMRWEMDPFAVAQKTYFVNDGIAYEAQLVNAIITSRAPLVGRLRLEWSGEGEDLKCTASATFIGEEKPHEFTAELKTITTRNSPLWKQQPKQQLGYFASRAWARLYCPDVLHGVYTREEMEDVGMNYGPENAINVTPDPKILEGITEGIKAEKAASTPAKASHDPETGEIYEEIADQNKKAADSEPAQQPIKIPAKALPADATKTDWEGWTEEWLRLVPLMSDEQSLVKLRKLNESILGNLEKLNPPKFNYCLEAFTERMIAVGGVQQAA